MTKDAANALPATPDSSHIAQDATVAAADVNLSTAEMATLLADTLLDNHDHDVDERDDNERVVVSALFGRSDYSHIAHDATVTVSITATEMAALLGAYDRGLDALDQDERHGLNVVIAKLKDELWP